MKNSDVPQSNATHSENITPRPCSTAKHNANSLLKWDELHLSLQNVLPPDASYSYVVETYQEISDGNDDSPHFLLLSELILPMKMTLNSGWKRCLITACAHTVQQK